MRRLTGRHCLCRRFQFIKLRPTHWAICFLWPRCCFSHFLAKTKCDSHYYRVLSSLSQSLSLSSLFLIPFGRRCKNVVAVVVARRHYYYCFYRSFVLLSATPCVHSSAKMDLFFTTWLLWLRLITNITQHEMLLPFFCSPFFMLLTEVVNDSDCGFWLRFLGHWLRFVHSGNLAAYVY